MEDANVNNYDPELGPEKGECTEKKRKGSLPAFFLRREYRGRGKKKEGHESLLQND